MTHLFLSPPLSATFPYIYQMEQSHQAAAACVIKRDQMQVFWGNGLYRKSWGKEENLGRHVVAASANWACSYITEKRSIKESKTAQVWGVEGTTRTDFDYVEFECKGHLDGQNK